jgi:hypothetical protein
VAIEGPAHCWPRAPRPGDHPGQGSPQRSRGPEGSGAGVIATVGFTGLKWGENKTFTVLGPKGDRDRRSLWIDTGGDR